MIKLYKEVDGLIRYWETWEHDGVHIIHRGRIGETGETKELRDSHSRSASDAVDAEIEERKSEGYEEIPIERHDVLLIEYAIEDMGATADLDKLHSLEARMNETLGWTGLGHCDGCSIGSGTMEVCCMVVDFESAREVINKDLAETEFSDYSRIYREE
ncbi:MAG: hypothetical protein ACYS8Z_17415 [Planctomycetota bacterium]|jgi:hypothetical protein